MDNEQAYKAFWASFGLNAYDENTVPESASLPYITYEYAENGFDDGEIALTANLWDGGKSWGYLTKIVDNIKHAIGYEGVTLRTDEGYIWIKRRSPFAQRTGDPNDNIRRIMINISVEFF